MNLPGNGDLDEWGRQKAIEYIQTMDPAEIGNAIRESVGEFIVPHLVEVRKRGQAESDEESPAAIRQAYNEADEAQQNELFEEAVSTLCQRLMELRLRPATGAHELKDTLRDPHLFESLLLVFEDDEVPDEVIREQKVFATDLVQMVGVYILPEIYTQQELLDICERTGVPYKRVKEAEQQRWSDVDVDSGPESHRRDVATGDEAQRRRRKRGQGDDDG